MNTQPSEIQNLIDLLSADIRSVAFQEMMWSVYVSFLSTDYEGLSENEDLKPFLSSLSRKRSIRLLRIIKQLCERDKKEVFCAGVQLGAKLILDILK